MNSSRRTEFSVAVPKRDLIAALKTVFGSDVVVQALPADGDDVIVEKYAGGVLVTYSKTFMLDNA